MTASTIRIPMAVIQAERLSTLSNGYYAIDTNNLDGQGFLSATNLIDNSSTEVGVTFNGQDAVEPEGTNAAQPVIFTLDRTDSRNFTNNSLTVHYTLSGSATNGVDFTNLSGVVTFAPDQLETNIFIEPLTNPAFPGDKTVTLALFPGTNYFINTNNASQTMVILDNNIQFQTVIDNVGAVAGLGYDPYVTNLIFSTGSQILGTNFDFWGLGTNITRVGANTVTNLTVTNWSTINVLVDEVYFTFVTNASSGFTNGTMFFGSDTNIGFLSSNAATANLNWCVLSNATETNSLDLRGAICMDTTGAFSNNIIAVTSDAPAVPAPKGVWEVDSQGNPTLLTNINAILMEGLIVVPNNFGPWSKQILTGDEQSIPPTLFTIDTNRNVTPIDSTTLFPDGVHCESIQLISPNQSLYLCDPNGGLIAKLPKSYFTNYVGDLLIEDGGEVASPAMFLIVHWDAASTNFVTRRIRYNSGGETLEGAVFAPIELPAQ